MKEELKEKLKNYIIYILIFIIISLIIIIGFIYGNKTTEKIEEQVVEIKQEEKEVTNKYIVEIKGEVAHPGVYELDENKRVNDVIKSAGGLTKEADTNYINLSKKIKDEMVIIIYSKKEIEKYQKSLEESNKKEIIKYQIIEKECVCPNTNNDACIEENNTTNIETKKEETTNKEETKEENKLININTASLQQLQTLTGIGESKAKKIIEYRNENKFTKIEDIKNVSGIGDSLFEKIKDYITI